MRARFFTSGFPRFFPLRRLSPGLPCFGAICTIYRPPAAKHLFTNTYSEPFA
jgi:hypothetical protein